MLGKVIVNYKGVAATVHKVLRNSTARIGGDILHGSRIACRRGNDNGVVHCAGFAKGRFNSCYGACLLTDGNIDAHHIFVFLVHYCINGDRGFTGLMVADDKFTLSASDREHGVDYENAGFHGAVNAFALHNAGRRTLDGKVLLRTDGLAAVNCIAKRVYHSAKHPVADRNTCGAACAHNAGAFHNVTVVAEQNNTCGAVGADILCHALDSAVEQNDFAVFKVTQTLNNSDSVADGENKAHLLLTGIKVKAAYVFTKKGDDFIRLFLFDKRLEGFAKLADSSQSGPVIVVVARENAEAAHNGRVNLDYKVDLINFVLFKHIAAYFFLLFVSRGRNAVNFDLKNLLRRFLIRNENIVVMLHRDFLSSATVLPVRRINSS